MPAPKQPEPQGKAPAPAPTPVQSEGRKPWKKKSPVAVVVEQADKLRKEITEEERALNVKKQQLKKFEEAIKLFDVS